MLQISNLTKIYQTPQGFITALKNVSFTLGDGDFTFLIGKSGAGKSTLIRMIIRQEQPTFGDIQFEGLPVATLPSKFVPEYRRNVGVIFQDYKLLDNKTVYENIAFILEMLEKNSKEIKETTEYLLDLVGLTKHQSLFPRQLSGGEKRRVVIARSLASNPKLLIADEPTADLDPFNAEAIMSVLEKINSMNTTIIMSTHDMNLVNSMKKRVLTLEKGFLIGDQTKSSYDLHVQKAEERKNQFTIDLQKQQVPNDSIAKLMEHNLDSVELLLNLPAKQVKEVCKFSHSEYQQLLEALTSIKSTKND